jgi:DNA-binding MarR family transcriptional regulator
MNDKGDEPAEDIEFQLWRLLEHTRFVIARSREKELAQYGLTLEQSHVLDILHHCGGMSTIREIVNITMRQHHSISTLVNRMVKQGLVKKIRSKSDARQYNVVITETGELLFRKTTRNSITDIFAALSESDRKGLGKGLSKLMVKAYQVLGKEYQSNVLAE